MGKIMIVIIALELNGQENKPKDVFTCRTLRPLFLPCVCRMYLGMLVMMIIMVRMITIS